MLIVERQRGFPEVELIAIAKSSWNDGSTRFSGEGGEYISLLWVIISKLDDKLLKYDEMFSRWVKNFNTEKPTSHIPPVRDKYFARSEGISLEEYRKKHNIEPH